jgi:hypothetical protein
MMTDELRQRMRAAVQAERAHAAGQVEEPATANGRQQRSGKARRPAKGKPAAKTGPDAVEEPPVEREPAVSSGSSVSLDSQRSGVSVEPAVKPALHVDDAFTDEIPPVQLRPDGQALLGLPQPAGAPPVSAPQPVPPPVSVPQPSGAGKPVRSGTAVKPPKSAKAPKPVKVPKSAKVAKAVAAPARPAQPQAAGNPRGRRRRLTAVIIALTLIVVSGADTAWIVMHGVSSRNGSPPSAALQRQQAIARDEAAAWVANHVRLNAVVSCDPAMCSALRASGFPPGKLRTLGPSSPYPVKSDVVVETPAVRHLFGTSLDSLYAPDVLAAVGSGDATISVRVIARDGAAAYGRAIAADLAARKASGAALLKPGNGITVSPLARQQLMTGQVDSRLLIALAALAAAQPIDIVEFGNVGSGGSADIPLRFADLSTTDPDGQLNHSAYGQSLQADLGTAPGAHPATMSMGLLPGDHSVLRIEFLAPSQLGLLGP